MAWKDWPYWLKGGIIGVIVCIVSVLLPPARLALLPGFVVCLMTGVCGFSISGFGGTSGTGSVAFQMAVIIVINSILYFLAGALIGWITGKIKSKKQDGTK